MAVYPFSESDMRFPIKAYIDQAIAEAGPGGGGAPEVMFVLAGVQSFGYGFTGFSSAFSGTVITINITTPRALGTYVAVVQPFSGGGPTTADIVDLSDTEKEIHIFVNGVAASAPIMFALWHIVAPT